ncbi:MAG: hypothetical protein NW226_04685 [Microscillaceae bacterium]|nr:hypothetical protein [Microscillaceae bacterium]
MVKFKFYFLFPYLVLLLITSALTAQNNRRPLSSEDLFFAKGHNRFVASVYVNKGKTEREYGSANLENRLGWGFSFTWLHTYHINPTLGFEWGLGYGAIPLRYYFDIKESESGDLNYGLLMYGTDYIEYLHLPIQMVFRKPITQKLYFNVRPGISVRYILLQELTLEVINTEPYVEIFDSYSTFDNTPRVNFNLGTGISWVLPHFDMLDFQLMANISPYQYIFNEYYFFPGTAYETFGRYKSKGTYIGFSVGYTFTGVRKMIKRARG